VCQDGSKEFEQRSETEKGRDVSKRFGKNWRRPRLSQQRRHLRWNLALSMRPRNQTTINAVENNSLSKTKKCINIKIQYQDNARRFLRYSRIYYDSVRTTRSNRESDVLHWAFDKVSRKNSKKETGVVEEWLNSPPGERSSAQCTTGSTVSGKKTSSCASSCSLPDLAPCDFFLFPKLKHLLKETLFHSTEDIHRKTMDLLKAFTQNDFQKCFHACSTV
jgi:hypothetical protein